MTNKEQLDANNARINALTAKLLEKTSLENPMTDIGDLIVGGENGTPTRLPIGNFGQVLKVGTNGLEYGDESGDPIVRFPNATIVGEPLIQDGQVSRFSTNNYMQFPFIVDMQNRPFEIDFAFTTGTDVATQQNILDSAFGLALAISNSRGLMAISNNGTSWDIGSQSGTNVILPNTTYYAKLTWDTTRYVTSLSTNGVDYVEDIVFESPLQPYPKTIFIGGSNGPFGTGTAHPFFGSINMNKASLKISGLTVWVGMDDAGLATRADISLSNIDQAGIDKIKEIAGGGGEKRYRHFIHVSCNGDLPAEIYFILETDDSTAYTKMDEVRAGYRKYVNAFNTNIPATGRQYSVSNDNIVRLVTAINFQYASGLIPVSLQLTFNKNDSGVYSSITQSVNANWSLTYPISIYDYVKEIGSSSSSGAVSASVEKYMHNVMANATTQSGTWRYQFELENTQSEPYTQIGQVGHYLYQLNNGVRIPASGMCTLGNDKYIITAITAASSDNMVKFEMYNILTGEFKDDMTTGAVEVTDVVS